MTCRKWRACSPGWASTSRKSARTCAPHLKSQYVRDGLFEFNPNRHDYGDKEVLNHQIKGTGLGEIDEARDMLASLRQPHTSSAKSLRCTSSVTSPPLRW